MRANVIARIWNWADERQIDLPDLSGYGWESSLDIKWIVDAFPGDVEQMLVQSEADVNYDNEDDDESDDQSDVDYCWSLCFMSSLALLKYIKFD